jgi:hypothetical protein
MIRKEHFSGEKIILKKLFSKYCFNAEFCSFSFLFSLKKKLQKRWYNFNEKQKVYLNLINSI